MKIFRLLSLISFTLTAFIAYGQNTLWFTNGKKIEINEFKIENKNLISYKTLKNKYKTIESFDVYSITPKNGSEIIIYSQDTSYAGSFNLPEMRDFVQGQSDAIQNFKSPLITAGGIVLVSASPFILNPVFVILFSGAYCATIGITKPSEKKLNIPMEYKNNEHYLLGYKKEVKHKRIKNAIIGSGIGLLVGFTTFAIVGNK
jgi:hypothetical protein